MGTLTKRLALVLIGSMLATAGVAGSAWAAAGDLDPTFDSDGRVTTSGFAGNVADANDVAIQADGRIVAAGHANPDGGDEGDFALARYTAGGALDPSFDFTGLVTTGFSPSAVDEAFAVLVQPDQKIVAAGMDSTGPNFGLMRFTDLGGLDGTFGSGGRVSTAFGAADDNSWANDVAIEPGADKLVAVGLQTSTVPGVPVLVAAARYNAVDGSLDDPVFSGDGKTAFAVNPGISIASAVAIQPDDKVVIAGDTDSSGGTGRDVALVRLGDNGSLDPVFDGDTGTDDGKVTTDFGGNDSGRDVALQPDGKIVVAGESAGDVILARYRTDGSLDTSFSGDGKQKTNLGSSDVANAVAIQPDGKIVVAGSSGTDFALVRYAADGTPDTSFGSSGVVFTDFGGTGTGLTGDAAFGIALQPDGRIVAAGRALPGGTFAQFGLARYLADSAPSPGGGGGSPSPGGDGDPPPGGSGGAGEPVGGLAPEVANVEVTKRFSPTSKPTAVIDLARSPSRTRKGGVISWSLDRAARVEIQVQKSRKGIEIESPEGGRKCVKRSNKNKRKLFEQLGAETKKERREALREARCLRFTPKGKPLTREGREGSNRTKFTGRIGKKPVGRGRFRVEVTATDAAGDTSEPEASNLFKIVKPKKKKR